MLRALLPVLIVLFTVVPAAEIAVILVVGNALGAWWTFALLVATGVAGGWLARREGLRTVRRFQETLAAGRVPARELVDGLLILIAGVVLLTPGFLTDVLGLVLLFPPTRVRLGRWVEGKLAERVVVRTVRFSGGPGSPFTPPDADDETGGADDDEDRYTIH